MTEPTPPPEEQPEGSMDAAANVEPDLPDDDNATQILDSGAQHPTEVIQPQNLPPDHATTAPTTVQAVAPTSIAAASPGPGSSIPTVTPGSAFTEVRARWLILFALAGLLIVAGLGLVLEVLTPENALPDELFLALFYLPLVAWAFFLQWRNKVRLVRFFKLPRIGQYWWVVLGMVPVLLVFSLGASILTAAVAPDYVDGAQIDSGSNVVVLLFTIAVIPPVVEELIFRGLLLERWAVKWRLGTALIVQAILFGILHVDPIGASVFGLVMGLMYLRCRSLWVPIVMHALNNGLVVLVIVFAGDAAQEPAVPSNAVEAGGQLLAGLFLMAVATPFLVIFIKRNWPGPDSLTPYEEAELGAQALPPRRLGKVRVSGVEYRATVTDQGVVVSRDRAAKQPLWRIPFADVSYFAVTPDWRHLLLMGGGGQLQLEFVSGGERLRYRTLHAVAQRVTAVTGEQAAWWR